MKQKRYSSALLAYQLVLGKAELVAEQELKLHDLEKRYQAKRHELSIRQSIWDDFYAQTIGSLRLQLEALKEIPSYIQKIQARKALCYLEVDRPIEAILLSQSLIRQNVEILFAHKIWIRSVRKRQQLDQALEVAKLFINQSRSDEEIEHIIFEIGIAQLESNQFEQAAQSFQTIIESSNDQR
ncbi:MAG: hypothetical protein F6K21_17215, partial [Symploca sp. SIO2D2]|nr:hypothetical protein [Symploca sp. SIO2D2]